MLITDPTADEGYAWGKPIVPLDDSRVWSRVDDTPLVPLPHSSDAERLSHRFDGICTTLVDELQATFDGRHPLGSTDCPDASLASAGAAQDARPVTRQASADNRTPLPLPRRRSPRGLR